MGKEMFDNNLLTYTCSNVILGYIDIIDIAQ